MGYDGKGQITVATHDELAAAWAQLDRQRCVLEQRLDLDGEVSVVLARGTDGEIATYPTAHNTHVDGILDCTVVPFDAPRRRPSWPRTSPTSLDYVGVLAVEMFVVGGQLLVNELAPRPHNSGHWTLDAARTSQFEQQVRAVCGVGLGDPSLSAPAAAMVNLLGDLWADGEPDWSAVLADPGASLHLYGKTSARPGRKMGHITVTAADPDEAERRAQGDPIRLDGSVACPDHDRRNLVRLHHGSDRLARPDLQQLVVPAGHLRDRVPRLGDPDRAERDLRHHRRRRCQSGQPEHLPRHRRSPPSARFSATTPPTSSASAPADGSTGAPNESRSSPARWRGHSCRSSNEAGCC